MKNKHKKGLLFLAIIMAGMSCYADMIIDYDDGISGNGVHEANINSGNFDTVGPWVPLDTSPDLKLDPPAGVSGHTDGLYVGIVSAGVARTAGQDTGYTLKLGDQFSGGFRWQDENNWLANNRILMELYYTDDNTITGTKTPVYTFWSNVDDGTPGVVTFQHEAFGPTAALTDVNAVGKNLFVKLRGGGYTVWNTKQLAIVDDVYLEVVPEPGVLAMISLSAIALLGVRRIFI